MYADTHIALSPCLSESWAYGHMLEMRAALISKEHRTEKTAEEGT
jgi:hypothetical protein